MAPCCGGAVVAAPIYDGTIIDGGVVSEGTIISSGEIVSGETILETGTAVETSPVESTLTSGEVVEPPATEEAAPAEEK